MYGKLFAYPPDDAQGNGRYLSGDPPDVSSNFVIKEDILGFNHISIQAKRYALDNNVQRHEVQSFVGAVAGTPSKKGVFITTSDYTKGAMEYVESLNGSPTIILINGQQLTEYIYDYGLGLQTEKVLKVMKMDMDYWDAMDNA